MFFICVCGYSTGICYHVIVVHYHLSYYHPFHLNAILSVQTVGVNSKKAVLGEKQNFSRKYLRFVRNWDTWKII